MLTIILKRVTTRTTNSVLSLKHDQKSSFNIPKTSKNKSCIFFEICQQFGSFINEKKYSLEPDSEERTQQNTDSKIVD